MWRSGSERVAVLAALAACTGSSAKLTVCARGDRAAIAAQVATIELHFLDGAGVEIGAPVAIPARDAHVGSSVPDGAVRFRALGLDGSGTQVARGDAELTADGGCACFALDAQAAAVCHMVSCKVAAGACRFFGGDGSELGTQTVGFGEGGDVTGVTTDTFLEQDQAATSHDGALLEAGPSPTRVALLRFDLSALPATAVIDGATLSLHACSATDCGTSHSLDIHPVLEAWSEAATWNERTPGTAWSQPGCAAPPSCGTDVIGAITDVVPGATLQIPLAAAEVASWVTNPATNQGLAISRPTTVGTAMHADSSESASPPRLDVAFHLP